MAKRKNKRKKKSTARQKRSSKPAFVRLDNPFAGIPQDDVIRAFVKAGSAYAEEFEQGLSRLQTLLMSVDPTQLLTILTVYGLSVGVTESGRMQRKDETSSIGQHHVEFLQAFALRTPQDQFALGLVSPDTVQEVWDLLIVLGNAFDRKRYRQAADAKSEQEKAIMLVQERLRLNTQCVRGWGYFRPVLRILRDLYGPLDSYFEKAVGLSATSLVRTFECLIRAIEDRINQYRERLRPALQARTVEEAAVEYCRAFPEVNDRPEDLVGFFENNGVSLSSARAFFITHAQFFLRDLLIFSVADMSQMARVNASDLRCALDKLSLSFGDLRDHRPEYLFLDNPVWTRPLIRLTGDEYCCLLPHAFFSFAFHIMDGLLTSSEVARNACVRRRADFLEAEIERLITVAFPRSPLKKNFVWEEDNIRYETDLVAKVDSYVLIVEAKSGAVSWPSLRGAPLRARQHIEELFIAPARQSQRLARTVERLLSEENNDVRLQAFLPFDATGVREIVRLSVTLEDLASIQTNLAALRETGWLPTDLEFAPTISLPDLQIVFEILRSMPERLHYLIRRAELERNMRYAGDEIDLLGFYLETGFNFTTIEFGDDEMLVSGMSKAIDDYYEAQDHGITGRKPSLKSTKWWLDIRQHIKKRAISRWSEVAIMLLNVSYREQQKLERMFKKVVKKVRKSKREPSYINSVTLRPSEHRTDALAVTAFRERDRQRRHERMEDLAAKVFNESHVDRCLVIGVNVDRDEYPYSVLGVFDRRKPSGIHEDASPLWNSEA